MSSVGGAPEKLMRQHAESLGKEALQAHDQRVAATKLAEREDLRERFCWNNFGTPDPPKLRSEQWASVDDVVADIPTPLDPQQSKELAALEIWPDEDLRTKLGAADRMSRSQMLSRLLAPSGG
jgi:hypothetical protein